MKWNDHKHDFGQITSVIQRYIHDDLLLGQSWKELFADVEQMKWYIGYKEATHSQLKGQQIADVEVSPKSHTEISFCPTVGKGCEDLQRAFFYLFQSVYVFIIVTLLILATELEMIIHTLWQALNNDTCYQQTFFFKKNDENENWIYGFYNRSE